MKHTFKNAHITYDPKRVLVLMDLDDVLVDWKGEAAKLYRRCHDLEETGVCDNKTIDWMLSKDLSELIESYGPGYGVDWWATLPLTPWAEDLENLMQELYEEQVIQGVVLCTNPGQHTGAYEGKRRWMEEHGYNPCWQMMTKHKWLCAWKNTVLVDDMHQNVHAFEEAGGEYFLWPKKAEWEKDLTDEGEDRYCPLLKGLILRTYTRLHDMRLT